MFQILKKEKLAPAIYLMDIHAPRVAESAMPGQFVIVRVDEKGERVPLTIADYNPATGAVTIVIQTIGASTYKLCDLNAGDSVLDFVGPLGLPSDLCEMSDEELAQKRIIFVGGGLGAAPIYPQVKYLAERGFKPDVIIGAKTKAIEIMRSELEAVSANYYQATDDGTDGFHGMVTNCLQDLVQNHGKQYNHCVTIGPMIMMKFVAKLTQELNIPTIASLNTLMVDGTGMCGACRVSVGNKMRFTCVEGPEFDAHQVNFDEALRRQAMYKEVEKARLEEYNNCKLS
ncbi:MAG: sulfide/dihydroorotate dehydrogenase-like FAD/NAD-binding protein [Bacteroides sp.]